MTFTLVQAQQIGNNTGSAQPLVESVTTTTGNMLAVWVGSTLTNTTNAIVPAFSVSDSASNFWYPVAYEGSAPSAQGMWWVCPNALSVDWVSIAPTGYFTNVIAVVCEFSGLPANYYPIIDTPGVNYSASATTLAASMTCAQSDYTFSLFVSETVSAGTVTVPSGMTAVTGGPWSQGLAANNPVTVHAAYGTAAAGALTATWTMTGSAAPMVVAVMGISQASHLPTQVSANRPTPVIEMAFGSTPAQLSTPVMFNQWTDVTSRAIGSTGDVVAQGLRGRTYELSEPEAGTCTIGMNNWDGALNPSNVNSPYYPNVSLSTPVRISCFWEGRRYGLFYGYVSKWPQDWPDLPQFGLSRMECVDAVSVASSITMPGAYQGEILCDNPYACFPFAEQYSTSAQAPGTENGYAAGSIQAPIDANGLIAANSARTNQRSATYMDGNPVGTTANPILTGLSVGLLGDNGTGMGCTSYTEPNNTFRGPGAVYVDPDAPYVTATSQITVEFCFTMDAWSSPSNGQSVNLFTCMPVPESVTEAVGLYNQVLTVWIEYITGVYYLYVQVGQLGAEPLLSSSYNITALMGQPVHLVVRLADGSFDFWVNGGTNQTPNEFMSGSPMTIPISAWAFGQAHTPFQYQPYNGNYAIQYGTIYGYGLSASRILNHYEAAVLGFAGDSPNARFGRIHAWSQANLNPGAWPMSAANQVSMGAAYDLNGTPLSAALSVVSATDGGLWYANRVGNLMYQCRRASFNMAPSVTFGDSNTPGAEIPYLGNVGIDYDNTYLKNVVSTQQINGPETLVNAVTKDPASINQYFQRGPTQDTIESTSPEDAFDRTNWLLNKQQQPHLRLRALTVDAASNPSVFSSLLPIDIGTTATVNRRPMGASGTYSLPVSIQQIGFSIGPNVWQFQYVGTPYVVDNEVLQADANGYNTLGSSVLAW